jgi:ubiquinone/menaquinone biosynthesis C-methylase UbiE
MSLVAKPRSILLDQLKFSAFLSYKLGLFTKKGYIYMILTKFLMRQRNSAYDKNLQNILSCLKTEPNASLLDLGCDDGKWTAKLGEVAATNKLFGIEIVEERKKMANSIGINAISGNLNSKLPYDDAFFDIVHANQVIEHLSDTDMFISEIYRVLKPNGYVIISTENLASWHNIFALILGYMPFSLTNVTLKTADLGNPFAPHNGEVFYESVSWLHKTVFTTSGLAHLFKLFGFRIDALKGAGYYPFGNIFSGIDPFHSAFITIKATKPNK